MENSIEQNSLYELTALIERSSLLQEEKALWANAIPHIGENVAQDILTYLREYPKKISWATELLKKKTEAIKNNDDAAWNNILAEEEVELEKILNE